MQALLRFGSHEFKTPTNAILMATEMIQNLADLPNTIFENIDIVFVAAKQILYLTNDMLDYSSLSSQQCRINKSWVTLDDVVKEVKLISEILAKRKGLRFVLYENEDFSKRVFTDANRLKQILLNLLSNAIKFTKSGFV